MDSFAFYMNFQGNNLQQNLRRFASDPTSIPVVRRVISLGLR